MPVEVMRPTVPEVLPLVRALYERPAGGAGCCLHVLLDDGNVGDSTAQFCAEYARREGHADCMELAALLVQMSPTQRRKLSRRRLRPWRHPNAG